MMKFKTYYLLLIASLIFFGISFFVDSQMTFDVNIYDTYYVISEVDFYIMISFFVLILGLLYFIFEKFKIVLVSFLSKVHIIGTILMILLFLKEQYFLNPISLPKRYYNISKSETFNIFEMIYYILAIIFLQLLFIINIFVTLIKKVKSFRTSK